MNVLFLSQIVPYPPHGGVLQRGYHLLRELGREARVHLLAFVHPDVLPTETTLDESRSALGKFCESVEYFRLWPKASPVHRIGAVALGACSSYPFSVLAHRSRAYQQRVSEILAAAAVDLIHVDTIALSQFVPENRAVPTVLTHHNIESQLMERRADVEASRPAKWYLRRETRKLRAYEETATRGFDVNIVVSRDDEKTLAHMAPGLRTAVVPNGVDIEYFTPDPDQEGPALIYTGGMNMFANRDAVLYFLDEIWPLIRGKNPTVKFIAVGQDPPQELRDWAARDPRIVVTGYVPDIRPFVLSSAVYAVPLRVGGGTRLKVLDAMAMGKAMVSTSIGCEGIDVRPDEHLIVADSPEEFAKAALALLDDRGRRLQLGRAARSLVESRYSWRIVGRSLLDAYGMAISAHRGSR